MSHRILVFEDKLGITEGYKHAWNSMLLSAGLLGPQFSFFHRKASQHIPQNQLLHWSKQRKTVGFSQNPEHRTATLRWVLGQIQITKATFVVLMDPALLFIVNQDWNQATNEILRGGVYDIKVNDTQRLKFLVTVPISAINRSVKMKDIAALNNGISDKDEWDELRGRGMGMSPVIDEDGNLDEDDDSDEDDEVRSMEWYNPITVPYGKFCIQSDLHKLGRLLRSDAK